VLACFLVLSCEPIYQSPKTGQTELVVKNQSSVRISKIKYNGLYFRYDQSDTFHAELLDCGEKATAEFDGEQEGYVFFTLLDEKNDAILEVRTNEILAMPKGKEIVFTITDNTLVVVGTGSVSSTLINLTIPAVLRIENGSSGQLYNFQYKKFFNFKADDGTYVIQKGNTVTQRFYNVSSYSGYVLFGTSHNINIKVKE